MLELRGLPLPGLPTFTMRPPIYHAREMAEAPRDRPLCRRDAIEGRMRESAALLVPRGGAAAEAVADYIEARAAGRTIVGAGARSPGDGLVAVDPSLVVDLPGAVIDSALGATCAARRHDQHGPGAEIALRRSRRSRRGRRRCVHEQRRDGGEPTH